MLNSIKSLNRTADSCDIALAVIIFVGMHYLQYFI